MKRPEQKLHQAVARYLDLALPADSWWTTIGHGVGKLTKATAGIAKSCGVKPGVPDILIVYQGIAHFIELKAPKGKPSPVQIEVSNKLTDCGAYYGIARSLDDVSYALHVWAIRTKARIAA